eukprot:5147421-Karenia_brevis.AAC.1
MDDYSLKAANTFSLEKECFKTWGLQGREKDDGSQLNCGLTSRNLQVSSRVHPKRVSSSDHYLV